VTWLKPGSERLSLWVQCACTTLVALGAAYASYRHGRDFALRFGADAATAAIWPLIVDGLLTTATGRRADVHAYAQRTGGQRGRHGLHAVQHPRAYSTTRSRVSRSRSIARRCPRSKRKCQCSWLALRAGDPPAVLFGDGCHPVAAPMLAEFDVAHPGRAATVIEEVTGAFAQFLLGAAGDQRS
jgi:hypothetical protein